MGSKMAQQRLDRYFIVPPSSSKSTVSFLDLPASVRRRVYSAAGLVPPSSSAKRWSRMAMNQASTIDRPCLFEPNDQELSPYCHRCGHPAQQRPIPLGLEYCTCSRFPMGLLTTCRAVSNEVIHTFYSETRFEIAYNTTDKLSALENIGAKAVASLRDLTIRMNTCFCPGGPTCDRNEHKRQCHPTCKHLAHDLPLGHPRRGKRADQTLLADFDRLCRFLGPNLQAGALDLALVCECKDRDLASQLLASLQQLPTLRACSIHLSKDFDSSLRQSAEETRLRLLGYPDSRIAGAFRLRDLPKEIELQILREAGLAQPGQQLSYWRGVNHIQPRFYWPCMYDPDLSILDQPDLPVTCCCHHSTHSAAGGTCSHWHFNSALFLVDRQMERDARITIYRENFWMVCWSWLLKARSDLGVCFSGPPIAREQANLSQFLRNVRKLVLRLPCPLPQREGDEHFSWRQAIDNLVSLCAIEHLTLVVALPYPDWVDEKPSLGSRSPVWEGHYMVIEYLAAALRGRSLGDFFVFIGSHREPEGEGFFLAAEQTPVPESVIEKLVQELEQLVIGGSSTRTRPKLHYLTGWDDYPRKCSLCKMVRIQFGSDDCNRGRLVFLES